MIRADRWCHQNHAGRAAIAGPLTDDPAVTQGLFEMIDLYLVDPDA